MVDWLTQIVRTAGIERALKVGQVLFRTGQRTIGLFEVISGSVRLVRVDRAGREAVLHLATAGETLAEASLFAAAYHCDAIATTDAVVRLYPKAIVLAEFEVSPLPIHIVYPTSRLLSAKVRTFIDLVTETADWNFSKR